MTTYEFFLNKKQQYYLVIMTYEILSRNYNLWNFFKTQNKNS